MEIASAHSHFNIDPNLIPTDVWQEMLINVDQDTLKHCLLVSKTFSSILTSHAFWKKRCERYGISFPKIASSQLRPSVSYLNPSLDFRLICMQQPYGRNLIRNPSGEDGLEMHWKLLRNFGDGFVIESPPAECNAEGFSTCFASSYDWCVKEQTIDLCAEGIQDWVMDTLKPKITVSEWTCARPDSASVHILRVILSRDDPSNEASRDRSWIDCVHRFDEHQRRFVNHENLNKAELRLAEEGDSNNLTVAAKFVGPTVVNRGASNGWTETSHTFEDYDIGVRYVIFQSFGKDLEFWHGHFGSKMAKASVVVLAD